MENIWRPVFAIVGSAIQGHTTIVGAGAALSQHQQVFFGPQWTWFPPARTVYEMAIPQPVMLDTQEQFPGKSCYLRIL